MTDDYVNIYEPEHDEYAYLTDSPKSKQHQACNTSLIYYSPMRTCPIQVFCDLPSGVAAQLRRDTKNKLIHFFVPWICGQASQVMTLVRNTQTCVNIIASNPSGSISSPPGDPVVVKRPVYWSRSYACILHAWMRLLKCWIICSNENNNYTPEHAGRTTVLCELIEICYW